MAVGGRDFWSRFLNILEKGRPEQSDPGYYLPNQGGGAQAGEYANVIEVIFKRTQPGSAERVELVDLLAEAGFWAPGDDLDFWKNQEVNELDVNDLAQAAEARMPQMFDASGNQTNIGAQDGGAGAPIAGAGADVSPGPTAAGAAGQSPGVMPGGKLVKITRAGQDDLWAMSYNVSGMTHLYTFDSPEQMTSALGADVLTSGRIELGGPIPESQIGVPGSNFLDMGSAAPLVGQGGTSYQNFFADIGREAALRAGIRAPGKLGEYLANPEIQAVLAASVNGGWTDEQTYAEVQGTNYYRQELYPGIDRYLESGVPDPEGSWWRYHDSVEGNLESLGVERDADGTYRSSVGRLNEQGVSDATFNTMATSFRRAQDNPEFAAALDFHLDATAGRNITFDDVFDVFEGTTSPELEAAVERGIIQYQADQLFSTTLTQDQISKLASRTDLSEQEISQAFTGAEEAVLALGDVGLQRYGLTTQQLIDSAFGVSTEGGLSPTEVNRRVRKTVTEIGLADDPKAQFFTSFDRFSRPVREGLAAAAPEVG